MVPTHFIAFYLPTVFIDFIALQTCSNMSVIFHHLDMRVYSYKTHSNYQLFLLIFIEVREYMYYGIVNQEKTCNLILPRKCRDGKQTIV